MSAHSRYPTFDGAKVLLFQLAGRKWTSAFCVFFKKKSNKPLGTIKNGSCLVRKVAKTASFELIVYYDDKSIVNGIEITGESKELIIGERLQEGDNVLQDELI